MGMPPSMRPFVKFALTGFQAELNYQKTRDTSMRAEIRKEFSHLDAKTKSNVMMVMAETDAMAKEMAAKRAARYAEYDSFDSAGAARGMSGVTAPLGFWDPLGFTAKCSEGKLLFYREVEMKHGRVCMLATLGLIVAEKFHPFYGGNIDVTALQTTEAVPLYAFWSHFWVLIAFHELPSALSFEGMDFKNEQGYGGVSTEWETNPVNYPDGPGYSGTDAFFGGKGIFYTMRKGRIAGDFGFDPLGLKPKDGPDGPEFKSIQTKEINNGRLAMLATAGIIAQEMVTGKTVF